MPTNLSSSSNLDMHTYIEAVLISIKILLYLNDSDRKDVHLANVIPFYVVFSCKILKLRATSGWMVKRKETLQYVGLTSNEKLQEPGTR